MQHFDLSPLYRASIGFDQVSDLMNRVISTNSTTTSYPPYDIEKTADDLYRISIAVAGFSDADLNVEVKNKTLIISGKKDEDKNEKNLCVFISGKGTNLSNLIKKSREYNFPVKIRLILMDRPIKAKQTRIIWLEPGGIMKSLKQKHK